METYRITEELKEIVEYWLRDQAKMVSQLTPDNVEYQKSKIYSHSMTCIRFLENHTTTIKSNGNTESTNDKSGGKTPK